MTPEGKDGDFLRIFDGFTSSTPGGATLPTKAEMVRAWFGDGFHNMPGVLKESVGRMFRAMFGDEPD